jgi:hypothetical protein
MPTYRGGSGSRLHHIPNLTREEALHFLVHDPNGRSFARQRREPISDLADYLVEASKRAINKSNEVNMDSSTRILKNVRSMGEAAYTKVVTDYAKRQFPELTRERAFAKVFGAPDGEGLAIRRAWLISKGVDLPSDARDEPSDDTDDTGDGFDALAKLEALGAEVRKRNPQLTKAQAFTKAYADNPELAARERRQNRPRAR